MKIPINIRKVVLCLSVLCCFSYVHSQNESAMNFLKPVQVKFTGGILAEAINKSADRRIKSLPVEKDGWYFKIYSKDSVAKHSTCRESRMGLNWQGEHAGKWMITAVRAANRTQDEELIRLVKKMAYYLLE